MLISSAASCCQDVQPWQQTKWDHRSRNRVLKELRVCLVVQDSGSSSWSGGQGFGENPAMIVTCAIKHVQWRMALTELSLLLTESPKWLGSPHMPADLFCQRQCADKACLVPSHHCGHARTRKAEDAVQQSHYLALALLVGATGEDLHRASSNTFVHYDCRLICKYFDLILKQPFVYNSLCIFLLNFQTPCGSHCRSPVQKAPSMVLFIATLYESLYCAIRMQLRQDGDQGSARNSLPFKPFVLSKMQHASLQKNALWQSLCYCFRNLNTQFYLFWT